MAFEIKLSQACIPVKACIVTHCIFLGIRNKRFLGIQNVNVIRGLALMGIYVCVVLSSKKDPIDGFVDVCVS